MATPFLIKNYQSDGPVGAYLIVKPGALAGDVKVAAAAADPLIGTSTFVAADDNSPCDVVHGGIGDVYAGGVVAFGDPVTSDAAGKAVKATVAGSRIVGYALAAGAAGDIIPVLIQLGSI